VPPKNDNKNVSHEKVQMVFQLIRCKAPEKLARIKEFITSENNKPRDQKNFIIKFKQYCQTVFSVKVV